MSSLRNFLLLALILLPAAIAQGQDWEFYGVRVCNSGTLAFDVASAEKKPGDWVWSDYSWHIEGWTKVAPKECKYVWNDREWESGFTVTRPIVDLIFAFTDSTGLWGAAALDVHNVDTARMTASDQKFCVRQDAFAYDRPKGDPSSKCDSGYFLMPASTHFDRPQADVNRYSGDWEGAVVSIELGAKDRAIPFGPKTSTSAPTAAPRPDAPTPGRSQWAVLREAGEAERGQRLRKNVRAYLAAADTGFESYKEGAPRVVAGDRVWSAKEISLRDGSCTVTESATDVIFRCLEFTSSYREVTEHWYADLVKNVAAALPEDWKPASESDISKIFTKNVLAGKVFWSSSGLNYFIWTSPHDSEYQLWYQVLAPRPRPTAR